jgi:hypothetical protein
VCEIKITRAEAYEFLPVSSHQIMNDCHRNDFRTSHFHEEFSWMVCRGDFVAFNHCEGFGVLYVNSI